MGKLVPRSGQRSLTPRQEDPNPAWALVVGLLYIFRTRPGAKLMRDLERAVRRYTADPSALWQLLREGEPEVIDAPAHPELPPR